MTYAPSVWDIETSVVQVSLHDGHTASIGLKLLVSLGFGIPFMRFSSSSYYDNPMSEEAKEERISTSTSGG